MVQPTEPGLYWARWRGYEEPWKPDEERGELSPTRVIRDHREQLVVPVSGGGHGDPISWELKHYEWGSKVEPPTEQKQMTMTKLWTDDGFLHVQDEDHRVAASLDDVYAELGEDFAKRIAARIRSESGQFKLMREAVAQWLEEGGWKDGK